MAGIQKTCSITRILVRFPAGSAFRSLEIELVIPGGVLGQVSISWKWITKLTYTTTYFWSDLWLLLGCIKFYACLVTKTSIFYLSDSNWTLVSKSLLAFNSAFICCERNQHGYHNNLKMNKNQHKNLFHFVLKAQWNLLALIHFWN